MFQDVNHISSTNYYTNFPIIKNIYPIIGSPYNVILLIGAIISIAFGLVIPTGKVIVGLGIIKFRMPVSLVFCVNFGILLSGLMISKYIMSINLNILFIIIALILLALFLIYKQSKKINTIAVLTGAFGYLLIYISLIIMSAKQRIILPIVLYAFAISGWLLPCREKASSNAR